MLFCTRLTYSTSTVTISCGLLPQLPQYAECQSPKIKLVYLTKIHVIYFISPRGNSKTEITINPQAIVTDHQAMTMKHIQTKKELKEIESHLADGMNEYGDEQVKGHP